MESDIQWIVGKTVKEATWVDAKDSEVITLVFTDGTGLVLQSRDYEGQSWIRCSPKALS